MAATWAIWSSLIMAAPSWTGPSGQNMLKIVSLEIIPFQAIPVCTTSSKSSFPGQTIRAPHLRWAISWTLWTITSMAVKTVLDEKSQRMDFKLRASKTVRISLRKITIMMNAPRATIPCTTQLVTIKPIDTASCWKNHRIVMPIRTRNALVPLKST